MLIQILTRTPLYVWAILAFLVYRGMAAMRDRDVEVRKLVMIPAVMLVLSLQDISTKFGLGGWALAAWAAASRPLPRPSAPSRAPCSALLCTCA